MKIELIDMLGTCIEATFFNDSAKTFDPLIKKDKVYSFQNGRVALANKKFTTVNNDFCLTFNKDAKINQLLDDGNI